MGFVRRLNALWRTLFRGRALDTDLDRELAACVDMLADENAAGGMEPAAARRQARIQMGGVQQVKEEVRLARRGAWIESWWQDVRYGARMIRRTPGASAAAVLTLAIGIGATTAIFTVINAVVLRPLPYPDAARLLVLSEKTTEFGHGSVSYLNYRDWRRENRTLAEMGAFRYGQALTFVGSNGPERVLTREVSASLLPTLGVAPALGRNFSEEDDRQGAAPTIILSHRFWTSRLSGDPAVIGRQVRLNGASYTVVGVLPADFWFYNARIDAYVPMGLSDEAWTTKRYNHAGMFVVARLKPGVSRQMAQSDMDGIASALARQYPDANARHGVAMTPILQDIVGEAGSTLGLMLGAVGFVLLIACANVANLRLARGSVRRREMAIRTAIGAGRLRIVRQLMTESVLLALAGGACGSLLALWGTGALVALVPNSVPRTDSLPVDGRVLAFALVVSCLTGVVFGMAPALQALRANTQDSLRERTRGTTAGRHRLQDVLVAAEVALALVLLAGAGLMLRTVLRLVDVDPGFDPRGVLHFSVSLPKDQYLTGRQVHDFYRQAQRRIREIPGVEAVSLSTDVPLRDDSEVQVYVAERPKPRPENLMWSLHYMVGPEYLNVMKLHLLRGRFIGPQDVFSSPFVAVVDEAFARGMFPNEDPLGKHVVLPFPGLDQPREIVGIVNHVKHWSLNADAAAKVQFQFYMPLEQVSDDLYTNARNGLTLSLRSPLPVQSLEPQVRAAVRRLDAGLPLFGFVTMGEVVTASIASQRFVALLLAIFAACAFALSAIGIYGVMACVVAQRTHEIGIRLALGAGASRILSAVVARGLALAGIGLVVGILAALALTRFLSTLLFGVTASDPATFVAVTVLLGAIAMAASYLPARRASRVDPVVALRCE